MFKAKEEMEVQKRARAVRQIWHALKSFAQILGKLMGGAGGRDDIAGCKILQINVFFFLQQ